jgi:hypothetical protein
MWWCCGKRGKDQPGCKFGKHFHKDMSEDSFKDTQTQELERQKQLRYLKCKCCKEFGHSIDSCIRDPNLRSNNDIEIDMDRI